MEIIGQANITVKSDEDGKILKNTRLNIGISADENIIPKMQEQISQLYKTIGEQVSEDDEFVFDEFETLE